MCYFLGFGGTIYALCQGSQFPEHLFFTEVRKSHFSNVDLIWPLLGTQISCSAFHSSVLSILVKNDLIRIYRSFRK